MGSVILSQNWGRGQERRGIIAKTVPITLFPPQEDLVPVFGPRHFEHKGF